MLQKHLLIYFIFQGNALYFLIWEQLNYCLIFIKAIFLMECLRILHQDFLRILPKILMALIFIRLILALILVLGIRVFVIVYITAILNSYWIYNVHLSLQICFLESTMPTAFHLKIILQIKLLHLQCFNSKFNFIIEFNFQNWVLTLLSIIM